MFDFHMHSNVSYDSQAEPAQMLAAARNRGLKEICFTDHLDYDPQGGDRKLTFDTETYNTAYDHLHHSEIKIRRGMEFGMLPDNADVLTEDLKRRQFDFVIGSAHFVAGVDIYFPPYWEGRTVAQAEREYLETVLACVQAHDGFDVLGHLTYLSKLRVNPNKNPMDYDTWHQLVDAIFMELIRKDKGIEVNTSGVSVCGAFLPHDVYLRRFKQLGGKIVTVGSDSHKAEFVGNCCMDACRLVNEIFGYVCTFENRQPIFHKL